MTGLARRWLGYLAFATLFALACVLLGNWQLSRREEALEKIERIEQNYDSLPVPISEALPSLSGFNSDLEWLPVMVTGRYLVDDQVLVRGRPGPGGVGFEVLTPLQLSSGEIFVINRGWIPAGSRQDAPDSVPEPPSGEVTVVARVKPSEPSVRGRSAPAGQIATIQLDDLAERFASPTFTGAFGLLDSETPAAESRPAPAARPETDEGPHLSYAFQWFVFAVLGFIFLGQAVRRELRESRAEDPVEQARARVRAERRARRGPDDAEQEDALLDRLTSPPSGN